MANKSLKNASETVTHRLYYKTQLQSVTSVLCANHAHANAIWSRKKPRCLTTTSMTIYETYQNPAIVESGDREGYWALGPGAAALGTRTTTNWESEGDGGAALNRARSKMAGSDLNFGETLAELGEAYGLVTGAAARVAAAALAVKNGRFGKAATILGMGVPKGRSSPSIGRSLANNWLGYQFGVQPLISDAYNLVNNLPAQQKVGTPVVKRSGGHIGTNGQPTTKANYRGVVSNPGLRQLSELGLANPANLAWQLLPLSFLADWFIGIGTYLNAFTSGLGLSCVDASIVRQSGVFHSKPAAMNYYSYKVVSRSKASVGLIPTFAFSKAASISTGKIFTSAALIRSL